MDPSVMQKVNLCLLVLTADEEANETIAAQQEASPDSQIIHQAVAASASLARTPGKSSRVRSEFIYNR